MEFALPSPTMVSANGLPFTFSMVESRSLNPGPVAVPDFRFTLTGPVAA